MERLKNTYRIIRLDLELQCERCGTILTIRRNQEIAFAIEFLALHESRACGRKEQQ